MLLSRTVHVVIPNELLRSFAYALSLLSSIKLLAHALVNAGALRVDGLHPSVITLCLVCYSPNGKAEL